MVSNDGRITDSDLNNSDMLLNSNLNIQNDEEDDNPLAFRETELDPTFIVENAIEEEQKKSQLIAAQKSYAESSDYVDDNSSESDGESKD